MSPARKLAFWADQLRDLSAMGLRFAQDQYNAERYRSIQNIAMAMLALATGEALEQLEPLRASVFSRPTPLSVADAAIIDDDGRILLIQRADNSLWAMPGGALEVGETPAAGAIREALEETGIHCRSVSLVGIFDSRLCGTLSRHHLYQFVFLCQPVDGSQPGLPSHADEILDLGWFPEADLPNDIDPGHTSRIPEAFRVWRGDERAFFDKEEYQLNKSR